MTRWLLSLLFLLLAVPAWATTYYVDPVDGLDANAGTSEGVAWKTLTKVGTASGAFTAGDTIKFRRGQVIGPDGTTGTMTLTTDGAAGNPITFTDYTKAGDAAGLALPILDAGNVAITTWVEQTSNGLPGVYYNSYSGATFNGFFADRVWVPHASALTVGAMTTNTVWWNHDSNSEYAKDGAFADGIYWTPNVGQVPASTTTRKASNSQGIVVTDRAYLTFSNLHFQGGKRCLFGQSPVAAIHDIIVQDSSFTECQFAATFSAGAATPTFAISFLRNTITRSGRGLYIGALSDTGTQTTTASRWIDNTFTVMGEARWSTYGGPVDEEAISSQNSVNGVYQGNTVTASPLSDCIVLWSHATGDLSGSRISLNQCDDVKAGIVIGAAVGSTTLGNNQVFGNLITDCSTHGIKINISGTAASTVTSNTAVRCAISYYTQTSQSNWRFLNNLSLNPTTYHASWGVTSTSKPDYNSYYPATGNTFAENDVATTFAGFKTALTTNGVTTPDANSLTSDPVVLSQSTDYRTQAASPLRRAGLTGYPCLDVRGRPCWTPPDLGAYQATSGDLVTARTAATARATRSPTP